MQSQRCRLKATMSRNGLSQYFSFAGGHAGSLEIPFAEGDRIR